jgi:hypothetical protein
MKSTRFTIVAALLLLIVAVGAAGSGGSGYSRYGIGDLRYFADAQAMGMGSATIAVLSPGFIDELNPAAWVRINRTRFTISTLYEGFSTSDASSSAYFSQLTFSGAAIAIPIAPSSGLVASLGVTPYSRINYNVITPVTLGAVTYSAQYIGEGGVSLAYLGTSYSLGSNLHVGGKLDYYFGTLNYTTKQLFVDAQYANADVLRATTLHGFGGTFGAIYSGLGNVLGLSDGKTLNLGLALSTTSYLTGSDERFYDYNTGSYLTRDTVTLSDRTVRIPLAVGAGLSFATERLLLAADWYYQNWSTFTDPTGAVIRDSYRIGAGGELLPRKESAAPYTQRIAYRFGAFYNASYYELRTEAINEVGLSAGIGLPIVGDTRLNVGAEYAFRGTTDQQLQRDKILRISITLSGSELWFLRPEQE